MILRKEIRDLLREKNVFLEEAYTQFERAHGSQEDYAKLQTKALGKFEENPEERLRVRHSFAELEKNRLQFEKDVEEYMGRYIISVVQTLHYFLKDHRESLEEMIQALESENYIVPTKDPVITTFFFRLVGILLLYGEGEQETTWLQRIFLRLHASSDVAKGSFEELLKNFPTQKDHARTVRLLIDDPMISILWGEVIMHLAPENAPKSVNELAELYTTKGLHQVFTNNLRRISNSATFQPEDFPRFDRYLITLAYCVNIQRIIRDIESSKRLDEELAKSWNAFHEQKNLFENFEEFLGKRSGQQTEFQTNKPLANATLHELLWRSKELLDSLFRTYLTEDRDTLRLEMSSIYDVVEHLRIHILTELVFVIAPPTT